MFANVIFGFIDNAGLFFGGVYLEEIFALLPGGDDANVTAGYGNTFSDTLGIFLGTFCGKIIENITDTEEGPMWANAFGITIGCLLGIMIPKMIISDSSTSGLNKVTAR
jgi:Na+-translocating ferredoxin:NAD+ oxidoreductase RnfD subunit